MFQGTGSGVGKSIVAAAMCRVLSRRGFRVSPFKAQNMALNSFVTADGREMGRAQVFQAQACGLLPDVRMNPVLLKPSSDSRSQVIINGYPAEHLAATDYYQRSDSHWEVVTKAYDSLTSDFDIIVIEGAGSPAEINLQDTDIVNMKMAAYAESSVILVADIDRGGVFASLKGTFDLVQPCYRHLIKGFLINKFRGDVQLLEPGLDMFGKIVPVPVIGVLPWFSDIYVDEEDGVFVKNIVTGERSEDSLQISVIKLPRISNFTDFSPLSLEENVTVRLVTRPDETAGSHMIIIPGTKATIADLEFLKKAGWAEALKRFLETSGFLMGICGGYQILGKKIIDDHGNDGSPGSHNGLGFLPVTTRMERGKTLRQARLKLSNPALSPETLDIEGYEIHMGQTWYEDNFADKKACLGSGITSQIGIFDPGKGILGTYLHGILENDGFRTALLNYVRRASGLPARESSLNYRKCRTEQFDLLAKWLEESADFQRLIKMVDG